MFNKSTKTSHTIPIHTPNPKLRPASKAMVIGLLGPGGVGSSFLSQLGQALKSLKSEYHLNLHVRAIANSSHMLLTDKDINLSDWNTQLNQKNNPTNLQKFVDHLLAQNNSQAVIIDCTASRKIADKYLDFFKQGLHVITPNKLTNSGRFDYYQKIKQHTKISNQYYFYETTVCAGLPVIETLQNMVQSGDNIHSIEGIVSGTLSYIFNALAQGKSFANIIKTAKQSGYTEPDPRDDLSGMDVARKFVCLARELGFKTELENVDVCNLVPKVLRDISLDDFLQQLPNYNQQIMDSLTAIRGEKENLAYVGRIDQFGKITVGIQSYSQTHPFSRLNGTDNILLINTKHYHEQPLVIQGPGAGTDVTAAGIFADLLRLSRQVSPKYIAIDA